MFGHTTLFVIIASLFALLAYGRWKLSKKIVQGHIEKHRPVPWLWIKERVLLLFWGTLVVRSLAPTLLASIFHPLAALPVGTITESTALQIAGLVLLVVAISLQLRAKWELGANWSNAVEGPIVREGAVTTRGLYQWSRNPMYCGSLMQALALIVILQNVVSLGLGALTYLYVRVNIAREEALLSEVKGAEYALYCKNVPRFGGWKQAFSRARICVQKY